MQGTFKEVMGKTSNKSVSYGHHERVAYDLQECPTVDQALKRIYDLYNESLETIRNNLRGLPDNHDQWERVVYPYVGVTIPSHALNLECQQSYGVAFESGDYGITVTAPDHFYRYYEEQLSWIIANHRQPILVGRSFETIPYPFGAEEELTKLSDASMSIVKSRPEVWPHLHRVNDDIVDGKSHLWEEGPKPLSLFTAERVDYSLNRLHHYCGTSVHYFQRYILLTNYQRYIRHFVEYAKNVIHNDDPEAKLVLPNDIVLDKNHWDDEILDKISHLPQMPAYHLVRSTGEGVTLINIGVGPSNAKNITDHLAVLRPYVWIMLGHCAGLRPNQTLGDYVLAHSYVRDDHVLDESVPLWIPIPALAEVQVAIQEATQQVTHCAGIEAKKRLRTGAVISTGNRNWELHVKDLLPTLNLTRAVGLDMESATLAANGFRFRVPYGVLLCVSDKPLHGDIKLKGMASQFYEKRVKQHMEIGLRSIEILQ